MFIERQVLYHRHVVTHAAGPALLAGAPQLVHTTGGLTAPSREPPQGPVHPPLPPPRESQMTPIEIKSLPVLVSKLLCV